MIFGFMFIIKLIYSESGATEATGEANMERKVAEKTCDEWHTVTRYAVPLLFHEPHVETGYRLPQQPWLYYIRSCLRLHNETINVWSHLCAVMLVAYQAYCFSFEVDFVNDPYTWYMLSGSISAMAMYMLSAIAHCVQSRSELTHYVAFMFDYAGIGLYGFGSVVVHLMYCSEDKFYNLVERFYIPLGGGIAVLIECCCTIAKQKYTRPYPFVRKLWNITPVACIYILLITPVMMRIYDCHIFNIECSESIPYHVHQIIWFVIAAFFFASEVPQSYFEGYCDVFFHGHTLFHIAITIATVLQMQAVLIDFKLRNDIVRSHPEPSLCDVFGPYALVFLAQIICIIYFSRKAAQKLAMKSM